MRLLVTGAAGFVGPHVLTAARGAGAEAVASAVDLLDGRAVRDEVQAVRPDAVIHLASRYPDQCESVSDAVRINVQMTSGLLDALSTHAPGAAVLVSGSAAEYGMARDGRLTEDDELEPLTSYGAIKALLEHLVLSEPLAPGLRVLATRSFNHLGPGQGPGAAVGAWVRQIAEAERAGGGRLVTGRLDVVRDLLDVRDVADAYIALLTSGAAGVVNVCSGHGVTMREVAQRLIALATVPVELHEERRFLRAVDPPMVVGDPSRLHELTGLTRVRTLDESLRDALEEQRAATFDTQPPSSSQ